MSTDLEKLIHETKQVLHGLFNRPHLTDKLLSKPPFRFLHDLVSAVTASTGFVEGLYNEAELETATITDKTSKIVYLEKLILLVGICSGKAINVRPSKILAGLEPENTNRLLIALGQVVRNSKLDFEEAVRITLAGGQPGTRLPLFNEKQHSDIKKDAAAETKVVVSEAEKAHERKAGRNDEPNNSQSTISRKSAHLTRAKKKMTDSSSTFQHEQRLYSSSNVNNNEAKGIGGADDESKQQETSPSLLFGMTATCDGSFHMTRRMLEPIIKHLRLTGKLLGRPPFRFLHDIVGEVTKQTGFAEGLFEPYLLDSANVKDKTTKLLYLERIFELVGTQLGVPVQAKPTKVIAGLEPQNTNHFLQLLSLAALECSGPTVAVRQVLENHSVNCDVQISAEAEAVNGGAVQRRNRLNSSTMSAVAEPKSDVTQEANVSHFTTVEALQEKQGWERGEEAVSHHSQPKEESKRSPATDSLNEKMVTNFGWEEESETTISRRVEGTNKWNVNKNKQSSSIKPTPKMACRGPPIIKDSAARDERKFIEVESISKQQQSAIPIMVDGHENDVDDEEDVNCINSVESVTSNPKGVRKRQGRGGHKPLNSAMIIRDEEEAMKSAAAESKENTEDIGGGEGGIRLGRLQHKPASSSRWDRKYSSNSTTTLREADGGLEALRRTIEMLCQSTAPLGHSMDYVYEDLTMMGAAREKWRKEWQFNQGKLETEKETTEVALQPLKSQLLELEEKMREQAIKVNSVKATISHNDDKLQSLLALAIRN